MGNIFVVAACTAGKGRQVASFVGKIFVVRPPTTKTTNILPHKNYTLYGNTMHVPAVFICCEGGGGGTSWLAPRRCRTNLSHS